MKEKNFINYAVTLIIIVIIVTIIFYTFLDVRDLLSREYFHEPSTPLHDAVVLYYQNKQHEAKQLLLKVAENKKYAGGAYINYAIFLEKEGNYLEAEKYYLRALQHGEPISLLYIYALYNRTGKKIANEIIESTKKFASKSSSYWIEIRKMEDELLQNNYKKALECLERAVEAGLPYVDLFYVDPIYDGIRDDPQFKQLMSIAKRNAFKYRLLEKLMENEYVEYFKYKPMGVGRNLYRILNDKTNDKNIGKLLMEFLNKEESARDKAIALYWLARDCAKKGDLEKAKKHLDMFKHIISTDRSDKTGFVSLMKKVGDDLYANDPILKDIQ